MRKVLLRIVYPARAGNVNGFGCILLTGRLLSGILFSGHHHRPRLSLSDDLPSTVVPTMQVCQCPNPLLSFLQKTTVSTVSILFPTQKQVSQLSQCHNCPIGDIGDNCPNGDIGDNCPNGDKSRIASHVCERSERRDPIYRVPRGGAPACQRIRPQKNELHSCPNGQLTASKAKGDTTG